MSRVAGWLDATPAEAAALLVLLVGGALLAGVTWYAGRPGPAPPVAAVLSGEDGLLTPAATASAVHVAGAVHRPGLVEVPPGARVADALAAAGGPTLEADLDAVNLARPVTDGERIDVPRWGDPAAAPSSGGGASVSSSRDDQGRLNLNLATAAELEELPGVGPVLASRIVAFREDQGGFSEVGQLRQVAGIGEKTFQALADLVTV